MMTRIKLWLSYIMLGVSLVAWVLFALGEAFRLEILYHFLLGYMVLYSIFNIFRNLPKKDVEIE